MLTRTAETPSVLANGGRLNRSITVIPKRRSTLGKEPSSPNSTHEKKQHQPSLAIARRAKTRLMDPTDTWHRGRRRIHPRPLLIQQKYPNQYPERHPKSLPTDVQEELDPALFIVSDATGLDLTRMRPLRSGIAISTSSQPTSRHLGLFPRQRSKARLHYHVI